MSIKDGKNAQKRVRTNVITGFLGVGKTTAIQALLANKPLNERWAVLINEFGAVGLDKAVLAHNTDSNQGLTIKEVAGGCMCCTAGLPMSVALNQLLRDVRPDRLFIEPSGLGHPKEVLAILSSSYYQSWLDLRATLTLIDARSFAEERYTQHDTFLQQLHVADVIVMNKRELAQADDVDRVRTFLTKQALNDIPLETTQNGQLKRAWLDRIPMQKAATWLSVVSNKEDQQTSSPENTDGIFSYQHSDGHWHSYGFRFKSHYQFDTKRLIALCQQLQSERIKAMMNVAGGSLFINNVGKTADYSDQTTVLSESRFELITNKPYMEELLALLMACLSNDNNQLNTTESKDTLS